MTRPYPWNPGTFQPAPNKQPGTEEFARLMCKRFGFQNLGTWVVRNARGKDNLSVHAAGAAFDAGWSKIGRAKALDALDWCITNATQLGIVAAHDYASNPPRAWRCDRGTWRNFTNNELGPGGAWWHLELDPRHAGMAAKDFRAIWMGLPK